MIKVKISRIQVEAKDIKSFELIPIDSGTLPEFTAGSHLDVVVAPDTVRQYSLCNAPSEQHRYVIAVLREPESSGGSIAMHDHLKEGDTLEISAPRNHFHLNEDARKTWLFAGGIGITPILSMAERLHALDADFELHYCARNAEGMAFKRYLEQAPYSDCVHLHLDDGPDDQALKAQYVLAAPRPDNHVYVCGPEGFMNHVITTAEAQYWQKTRIHREYFKAVQYSTEADESFRVEVASTGAVYDIPADKAVTEVLSELAGIDIPVSCEQGVCGTCITNVVSGDLIHRDMCLSDEAREEGKSFTPCCSRGAGLVKIDL